MGKKVKKHILGKPLTLFGAKSTPYIFKKESILKIKIKFRKNRTSRIKGKGYSSTYAKRRIKLGPISLGFITVVLFSLLSLFYLAQSNQITTKGYILRDLEVEKNKILSENERLQVEAARLESLNKISEKADELSMVPVEDLRYFTQTGGVFVRK